MGDDGVGPHDGVLADVDRRDQDRAGADLAPVADSRRALPLAVEVGRDRGRADIDPLADLGVTQVSQVPHQRSAPQVRLLDLDERADLDAVVEHGPVAQVSERPDRGIASRS